MKKLDEIEALLVETGENMSYTEWCRRVDISVPILVEWARRAAREINEQVIAHDMQWQDNPTCKGDRCECLFCKRARALLAELEG